MRFVKQLLLVFLCFYPIALDASNVSGNANIASEGIEITTRDGKKIQLDKMTNPQSLDYKILSYLFGTMGPALACQDESCSSLMGELFRLFNISLSTVAVLILSYVIFMSAFNTASSGQFFNQQFSSSVLPLRSVLGISFLMPNAYGYSILQQIVMSVVLLGSSFATIIWNNIQVYAEQYQGLGLTTGSSSNIEGLVTRQQAGQAADEIVATFAAVAGLNYYANKTQKINFFPLDQANSDDNAVFITFTGKEALKDAQYAKLLYSNVERDFQVFISDPSSMDEEGLPLQLSESLSAIKMQLTSYFVRPGRLVSTDKYDEKKTPWIFLPNDFFSFIAMSPDEDKPAEKDFSVKSDLLTSGKIASLIGSSSNNLDVYSKISSTFPFPKEGSNTEIKNDVISELNALKSSSGVSSFFNAFSEPIKKLRDGKQQPIQIFLDYGVDELNKFFIILNVIIGVSFIPLLITGYGYIEQGTSNIALGTNIATFLFAFLNLLIMKLPVVLTFVFTLPLIPLLSFVSAVLSWFIQVVSSIIAAPIMALGMISPGPGLGRAAPSLVMLINLFLRPSLIVMGFIAALILFNTFCVFFTDFYLIAMNFFINVDSSFFDQTFITGLIINFFVTVIFEYVYLFAIIALITRCFNLVYTLPDTILVWIGGQPMPFGQDAQQSVQQVRQGIAQAGSSAHQEGVKIAQSSLQALQEQQRSVKSVGQNYRANTNRLMRGAKNDDLKSMEAALNSGVDVNEVDQKGMTALMHSAKNGSVDCFKALLDKEGIDLSMEDSEGKKASDYVQEWLDNNEDKKETTQFKEMSDLYEELEDKKDEADEGLSKQFEENKGLLEALKEDNIPPPPPLEEMDVNEVDEKGMTALMHSAKNGSVDSFKALLNKEGIDLSIKDLEGKKASDYVKEWLDNNQDKKETKEFKEMSDLYEQLKDKEEVTPSLQESVELLTVIKEQLEQELNKEKSEGDKRIQRLHEAKQVSERIKEELKDQEDKEADEKLIEQLLEFEELVEKLEEELKRRPL